MRDIATFIALNRFGLGARPGDADIVDQDPYRWFSKQLDASPSPFQNSNNDTSASIIRHITKGQIEGRDAQREARRHVVRTITMPKVMSRATGMINSQLPIQERLVMFWSNHFTVSSNKSKIAPIIPFYEDEAIRPFILGKFEDLLLSAIQHIAMVSYLDNDISMGPNSKVGKRRNRTLNENLAREILELHTLGVNGGYSQQDVIEFAKALTGWSHDVVGGRKQLAKRNIAGQFMFRENFHEPGSKTILGKNYHEEGLNEGRKILIDLARHPATAKHIATKLIRHFVSDNPAPDDIATVQNVFISSEGDLKKVMLAVIGLPSAWSDPVSKVKTPYELIISAHRAIGLKTIRRKHLFKPLTQMGHRPFSAPSPKGWPDQGGEWISPQSILRRIEWINWFAKDINQQIDARRLTEEIIGPVISDNTRQMIDGAANGNDAFAILFSSAEFQRR